MISVTMMIRYNVCKAFMVLSLSSSFLVSIIPLSTAQCTKPGWFGENCSLKCHCEGGDTKCTKNGTCVNGCIYGWMGDDCQDRHVGIYVGKDLKHVGSKVTCKTGPRSRTKIPVTMFHPSGMSWMRIWTNMDAKRTYKRYNILINNINLPCAGARYIHREPNTLDIFCDRYNGVLGSGSGEHRLTLTDTGSTHVCKINVSGGRNMALKQEIKYESDSGKNGTSVVDGEMTTCQSFKDTLSLMLSGPIHVYSLRVLLSKDINVAAPTADIEVEVYRGDNVIYNSSISKKPSITVTPPYLLRRVTSIKLKSANDINLCELEVYGECPINYVGRWCQYVAKPKYPWSFCSSDGCPGGSCEKGFIGKLCNETCPEGFYGSGCRSRCSRGCKGGKCNPADGLCECRSGGMFTRCSGADDWTEEGVDNTTILVVFAILIFIACLVGSLLFLIVSR